MVAFHCCSFCHQIIRRGEQAVFIQGRGLHAHRLCQLEATDSVGGELIKEAEPAKWKPPTGDVGQPPRDGAGAKNRRTR